MSGSRRCLLVECLPYHWEVLPSWVHLLGELGHEVEVAAPNLGGHREVLAPFAGRGIAVHDVGDLDRRVVERADFVLLNSLIHYGFLFEKDPQPWPDLAFLRELARPSLGVIHEPVHFVDKRVVHSFATHGENSEPGFLNLLSDGSTQHRIDVWSQTAWSLEGTQLRLCDGGETRIYETRDGGASYLRTDGAERFRRNDVPDEDLCEHLRRGRHALITLSRPGCEKIVRDHPGVDWILPFEPREPPPGQAQGPVAFAGTINFDTKAIHSLLHACRSLPENESITVIGGSRRPDLEADPFYREFLRLAAELGVRDKLRLTGYLPYGEFVEHVRRCRFLVPLIDDYVDSGAYLSKLSAAIPLSLGLGVPMILNDRIAGRFGLDFMVCYPGQDPGAGLAAARRLSGADYAAMQAALRRTAQRLHARNLSTLDAIVQRITAR